MKEVYKGNEILESFHQDHLFKYHSWLLKAAKKYNSLHEFDYDHIVISSLTPIEDGKFNIKEKIHRDLWIKKDWETYYKDRVSKGFIHLHRASFDIRAYDEKCIWSDKTGIKYRDDFYFDIGHVGLEEEENEYLFYQETKDLEVKLLLYEADIDKKEGLDSVYEMALIFQPELTMEEFEIEYHQKKEDEQNERIESWEGFEDEIY
jgi:hypothetical protein